MGVPLNVSSPPWLKAALVDSSSRSLDARRADFHLMVVVLPTFRYLLSEFQLLQDPRLWDGEPQNGLWKHWR